MKKGSAEDMFALIAQEEKATSQTEIDIIRLKKIILSTEKDLLPRPRIRLYPVNLIPA